jgi:hypothetical protein
MAVGIDGDDAAGAAEIEESSHLLMVDQIASSAGADAQRMFDAPTHEIAAFSDVVKIANLVDDLVKTKVKPSDMPATGDRKNFTARRLSALHRRWQNARNSIRLRSSKS